MNRKLRIEFSSTEGFLAAVPEAEEHEELLTGGPVELTHVTMAIGSPAYVALRTRLGDFARYTEKEGWLLDDGRRFSNVVISVPAPPDQGEWTIGDHDTIDKSFLVEGPGDVSMRVDYDDVNHAEVDAAVEAMVATLNAPPEAKTLERVKALLGSTDKAVMSLDLMEGLMPATAAENRRLVLERVVEVLGDIARGGEAPAA